MLLLVLLLPICVALKEQFDFLRRYGYIDAPTNAQVSQKGLENAVRKFQRMYGLRETGEIDENTKRAMDLPRCGLLDFETKTQRKKRYAGRWEKYNLGYQIKEFTSDLHPGNVERLIRESVDEWEKVSSFRFSRSSSPDIKIAFGTDWHNCSSNFDVSVLAHAFTPPDGQLHFNDYYHYGDIEISNYQTISLKSVAIHELGHILGLKHNDDVNSIMHPTELHHKKIITDRDIWELKRIYYDMEVKEDKEEEDFDESTTKVPKRTERPDPCHSSPDAISSLRGEFIVFKDEWMWRISREGEVIQQPERITSILPQVKQPVDAAVNIDEDLWLFIGQTVYVMTVGGSFLQLKHAPLKLTDLGLPREMDRVRLAYSWHYFTPAAVYLWGERQYWRMNLNERKVDSMYPRPIVRNWKNVPLNAHAAFSKDGELHFIAHDQVYKMNTSDFRLPMAKHFPKPLSQLWKHCNSSPSPSRYHHHIHSSSRMSFLFLPFLFSFLY